MGPGPGGHIPGAGHAGAATPMRVDGGGDLRSGPQLDIVPETFEAPGSGKQPPLGGLPIPLAACAQAGLPGGLSTTLRSASTVDEHRVLMGMVIEKIQSAESGLNESCLGLIKGFEVCFLRDLWEIVII